MGRRTNAGDSSLELLLDTITNTFGGILFIAILLSLLLRTTSRQVQDEAAPQKPMSPREQAALEIQIETLQDEAEVLRRRLASAPQPGDSRSDDLPLGQLSAAAEELERALATRAEAVRNTLQHQRDAATADEQVEMIEEDQRSVTDALAEARNRLAAANEKAAALLEAARQLDRPEGAAVIEQTVSLPRLRPSDKSEVGLYIRFDRIFMMHRWRGAQRQGPNTEQFVVVEAPAGEGVQQIARPKPGAGMTVDPRSIDADLGRLLKTFPPDRYVVGLIVFEDSFDVFQFIKGALVRAGYEYRPMGLKAGESVVDFGGTGEAQ